MMEEQAMPMSGLHDQVLSLGSAGFHNQGDVDAVVVDVVDAVDSDASERALEGGSLIYTLHAPRARAPRL